MCRNCKGHEALCRGLRRATSAEIGEVGCQKVCRGPVAGIVINGRREWFGRLRKPKHVRKLARLVVGGGRKVPGSLEKRRLVKRSGRPAR